MYIQVGSVHILGYDHYKLLMSFTSRIHGCTWIPNTIISFFMFFIQNFQCAHVILILPSTLSISWMFGMHPISVHNKDHGPLPLVLCHYKVDFTYSILLF